MPTSEALASNLSLVDQDPAPAPSPLQVLVIIGDPIVVFHENLHVPWLFDGTINFVLAGDIDTQFTGEGVKFVEAAPFTVTNVAPRRCTVAVNNNNNLRGIVGVPFHYDLELTTGRGPFIVDPTVENDPPIVG